MALGACKRERRGRRTGLLVQLFWKQTGAIFPGAGCFTELDNLVLPQQLQSMWLLQLFEMRRSAEKVRFVEFCALNRNILLCEPNL